MMEEFDVLVAGGGPAGSALALGLAREGCRVGLMEATALDSPRYGETLPPEINPVLRQLGLWDAFQKLSPVEAVGMISVWGDPSPVEVDFVRNVHGPGWHIDRKQFDRMLANEAGRAGAKIYSPRRVEKCEREGDGWQVGKCGSRILVDACGRNGLRIEDSVEREIEDELLAIALSISYSGKPVQDLRTCVETTSDGWWYSALLPEGTLMAMFFTDPEIYRREGISIYEQLKAAPLTAQRLENGHIRDSRVLHVTSSCRKTLLGNGWLTVGDSASSYDPLSGRGVFKALQHARSAACGIMAHLNGNKEAISMYATQVRREFDEYVRQRRVYYASERRWLEHAFWQARSKKAIGDRPPTTAGPTTGDSKGKNRI